MRTEQVSQTASLAVDLRREIPEGPWTVYSRSNATRIIRSVTRDDVHKSHVTNGFRPPLGYTANGSNGVFPIVYADVVHYVGGASPITYNARVSGNQPFVIVPPAISDIISAADRNRALVNMLRAVGDSKWSAGEMIAEMQGSIDLIASSARKLSNAMLAASKKNWRGVAKALDVPVPKVKSGSSAAQGWLEFQFGWAPVVSDIANSALFLSGDMDSRDPPIIMARTKLKQDRKTSVKGSTNYAYGIGLVNFDYVDNDVVSDEWKASVYFKLDDDFFRGLAQYGIVGLSTPWAVLPMSFIADWVLPIGDFLEALDATIGLSFLGGSETSFKQGSRQRIYSRPYCNSPSAFVRSGEMYAQPMNRFVMVRTPWVTPPVPVPLYVKNPFDTFKAVTSVALLKQFSSKP